MWAYGEFSDVRCQPSRSTHRAAANPSPYRGGGEPLGANPCTASTILAESDPTRVFQPASTVSTHSVSSRMVTQGTPSQQASFCSPPESVRTIREETEWVETVDAGW